MSYYPQPVNTSSAPSAPPGAGAAFYGYGPAPGGGAAPQPALPPAPAPALPGAQTPQPLSAYYPQRSAPQQVRRGG